MHSCFRIAVILMLLTHNCLCPLPAQPCEATLKEIFLTAHVDSQDEIDRLNATCRELDLALNFEKDNEGNRVAHVSLRGLDILIPQTILESLYYSIAHTNPYYTTTAEVRTFSPRQSSICPDEIKFISQRTISCHDAMEQLSGITIPVKKTPRIALCCSGGGVRASLAAAGFIAGLNDIGALDATTYVAGLSGSTWTIAPWMLCEKNFKAFYPEMLERIANGFTHRSSDELMAAIKETLPIMGEYLLKKIIFKEIPSVIDLYGYILARTLLQQSLKETDYFSIDLADQQLLLSSGRPLPLYTAVIPYNDTEHYAWLTFSPFEVSSDDLKCGVPAWAYGREFHEGTSVNNAPPLSMGFLLGLWGSALSVSFEEAYSMMIDNLTPQQLFSPLKYLIQSTVIGDTRFFPAHINNMSHHLPDLPFSNEQRTTVIDSGLTINLPLPPLLNPDREIDIIIICDASANTLGAPELQKAEEWARAHNAPFPYINYNHISAQQFTVFDDGPDQPEVPIVIYVPMLKNPRFSLSFDPQEHLGLAGFMNTLNFDYSREQATALAELMRQSARDIKDELVRAIKRIIARTKARHA